MLSTSVDSALTHRVDSVQDHPHALHSSIQAPTWGFGCFSPIPRPTTTTTVDRYKEKG
jgi:phosphoribosylamine-glycine ligase